MDWTYTVMPTWSMTMPYWGKIVKLLILITFWEGLVFNKTLLSKYPLGYDN